MQRKLSRRVIDSIRPGTGKRDIVIDTLNSDRCGRKTGKGHAPAAPARVALILSQISHTIVPDP
jgi:hypothetical protein